MLLVVLALLPVSFIVLSALPSDREIADRLEPKLGDKDGWVDLDASVVLDFAVRGKTLADAQAALRRRGMSSDTGVNAQIFEHLKAKAISLRIWLTAKVVGIALLIWGSISAAVYASGWGIGWVFRGFKEQ
jgi:hypothetical protein